MNAFRGIRQSALRIPHLKSVPASLKREFSTPPEKLLYPDNRSSSQHHDLTTFLAHAERSGLDVKSTVYVGTHFEYTVAASLSRYGFFLKRVGGASDCGIDLLGTWTLPSSGEATDQNTTIKVLMQCKAGGQRAGPNLIRELEGAFVGAPVGWRGPGVLGLLVSERPATKGVRESMGRSRWPMGYLCCSKEGRLIQMMWNRRAEDEGLDGFGVTTRHVEGQKESELVMLRNGLVLPMSDGT